MVPSPTTQEPGASATASAETLQNPGGLGDDVAEKGLLVPSPATTSLQEKPPPGGAKGLPEKADRPSQRWNESRLTQFRFFVALYCFLVKGMGDSAIGALIPYIETYYGLSYTVVSVVFLTTFPGYILTALSNNLVHHYFGQRGVAFIGPLCRLLGFVPVALHPPFPVVATMLLFPGVSNAFEESTFNAWIGNMQRANELLGFFHGVFGLGATIGPLIATSMVTRAGLPWYSFYYLMVALVALQGCLTVTAFWGATGKVYRATHEAAGQRGGSVKGRVSTRRVLREPIPWITAFFILIYVGVEVSVGGWVVTFMLRVRHSDDFDAGLASVGFWLGLTVGRIVLGFVTPRIGEKLATIVYMLLSSTLVLLFWLVPGFIASAVFVAFLGLCLGPVFPGTVVVATKLLPPEYHVPAIGFSAAFGGAGGAIFPFAVGAIAQSRGVQVLMPIALGMCLACVALWLLLPGGFGQGGLERARERNEKPAHRVLQLLGRIRNGPMKEEKGQVEGPAG